MGSYNDPVSLLHIDNCLRDNIPVIRRFSGGGTVFVDENCYFMSLLTNAKDIGLKLFEGKYIGPREIMQFTDDLLSPVFDGVTDLEFTVLEHVDYVLWDEKDVKSAKKIAGNAQKISKDKFDHHTSWLWKYDIEQINKYLAVPPLKKQPEYRNNRSHEEFLLPLSELFHSDIAQFEEILVQQLGTYFEIEEIQWEDLVEIAGDLKTNPTVKGKELILKTQVINEELKTIMNGANTNS